MVECQLPKLDVAGSSPVSRSIYQRKIMNLIANTYLEKLMCRVTAITARKYALSLITQSLAYR